MTDPIAETVEIPMPDGVVLRAHVVRPASSDTTPVPVILYRTPYLSGLMEWAHQDPRIDAESPSAIPQILAGSAEHPLADVLEAGLAVAVQACRGTSMSEGTFRWMVDEYGDGAATAGWFAGQPWCSKVLGAGGSYVSATQFATVLADPDALSALSPFIAPSDIAHDMAGRGGVPAFAPSVAWAVDRVADAAAKAGVPAPADLPRASSDWRHPDPDPLAPIASLTPEEWAKRLAAHPASAHVPGWFAGEPGAFDAGTYPLDRLRSLNLPALHLAGWFDVFLGGTLRNYTAMRQGPAAEHQHLVIGPWTHAYQMHGPVPYDFGPDSTATAGGVDRLQFDFWRRHGVDAEVDLPRVRLFVMGENAWRDVADWPVPGTEVVTFALGAGTLRRTDAQVPHAARPDATASGTTSWRHDPADPVPTLGGPILMGAPTSGGAHDQRPVQARDDVVSFVSDPLDEPLVAVGPVPVRLWASGEADSVDLHVTLTDVEPDGYSRMLTDGALRVDLAGTGVPAGEPVRVDVELWPTGNAFGVGHRIRLNVAASNWPRYVLSPDAQTVTLHHDADPPSMR